MSTTKNEFEQTWTSRVYGKREHLNPNDTYYDDDQFLVGFVQHMGRVTIVGMTSGIKMSGQYGKDLPPHYLIIDTHGSVMSVHQSQLKLE